MGAAPGHKEDILGAGKVRADRSCPGGSRRLHCPSGSFSRKKKCLTKSGLFLSFLFFMMGGSTACLHSDVRQESFTKDRLIPLEACFREYMFMGESLACVAFELLFAYIES